MLSSNDRHRIYQQAYLPEHLPDYVEAISGARADLFGDYLCFNRKGHLIFIGYPLGENSGDIANAYGQACEHFRPETVAVIAPEADLSEVRFEKDSADQYYRLDLPLAAIPPQVAYMVRRGEKSLRVRHGTFGREHKRLIRDFIKAHDFSPAQRRVYKRIRRYLKRSETAHLLEARIGDFLAAFTVVDLGAAGYAFYMFNFRSETPYVPGASDLLFKEMVVLAQDGHKPAINLGLGVNPGIRRFKEKWGGTPFFSYQSAMVHRIPEEPASLADKL